MIYSKDRKYRFAISNYREHVDASSGITHITIDFYVSHVMPEKDWILYHNGSKELYRTKLEIIQQNKEDDPTEYEIIFSRPEFIWVRLSAILIKDDTSRQFVEHTKDEEKRLSEQRQRLENEARIDRKSVV